MKVELIQNYADEMVTGIRNIVKGDDQAEVTMMHVVWHKGGVEIAFTDDCIGETLQQKHFRLGLAQAVVHIIANALYEQHRDPTNMRILNLSDLISKFGGESEETDETPSTH